jgi:hypothetical protein
MNYQIYHYIFKFFKVICEDFIFHDIIPVLHFTT